MIYTKNKIWELSSKDWEKEIQGKMVRAYLRPIGDSKELELYEGEVVGFVYSSHACLTNERPIPVVSVRLQSGTELSIARLESLEVIL